MTKEQLRIEGGASWEIRLELNIKHHALLDIEIYFVQFRGHIYLHLYSTYQTQLLSMPGNSAQDLYADLVAEVCKMEGSLSLKTKTRKNDHREFSCLTFQLLSAICSAQSSFH